MSDNTGDGLRYYLPNKDISIKIVVQGGKISSVALDSTSAYPDESKNYLLRFKGGITGKNVANVGVDTNGLLTSTKSTATSGVSEAFQNLAGLAGSVLAKPASTTLAEACTDGTHTFIVPATQEPYSGTACGLNVSISKKQQRDVVSSRSLTANRSGVYYRQAEPYLVSVSGGFNASALVFSPSQSPTYFLPISRTLFANGEADFGFVDGMPTKYNQSTDGEVVGLLTIPAAVIGAYFGAVGKLFESFKSSDEKSSAQLLASTKLEMDKVKYSACADAIKSKDDVALEKLDCGK
ncbi:hypothetical protein [Pseudomonas sp. NFACC02]|uniref:hypothetical protein n=1 Tax=Pseudomonas sp. NFACC02 TaxID=1566250 RepID=UPI0011143576|nr:hypothetical protein [Pseudomonas sp. NFACC02]